MESDIARFYPALANEQRLARLMDDFYRGRGLEVVKRTSGSAYDAVLRKNGITYTVEEKFRLRRHEDLAIEVVQNVLDGYVGWLSKVKADNLHYVFCQGERGAEVPAVVYALDWPAFRDWYVARLAQRGHADCIVSRKGVGVSLNLLLRIEEIPLHLVRIYDVERVGGMERDSTWPS